MIFAITPMRQRGKQLEQHQIRTMTPVIGDLVIGMHDSELGRMSTVATIARGGSGPEALPMRRPGGFVRSDPAHTPLISMYPAYSTK